MTLLPRQPHTFTLRGATIALSPVLFRSTAAPGFPLSPNLTSMAELCKRCQQFNIQALADGAYPWRGYRTKDVLISASEGCLFCSTLVRELLPLSKQPERSKIGDWIHFRALRREWTASNRVEVRGPQPSESEATGLNIARLLAEVDVRTNNGDDAHSKVEFHVATDEGGFSALSLES